MYIERRRESLGRAFIGSKIHGRLDQFELHQRLRTCQPADEFDAHIDGPRFNKARNFFTSSQKNRFRLKRKNPDAEFLR